jgi:flagellar protein FliO/FliZ
MAAVVGQSSEADASMDILDALRAVGALILVLGMLLGGAWLLRRFGNKIGLKTGATPNDLKVVEWRSLDIRRKLAVVRWGEREHLLVLAPTGDTLVASRDAPPEFKPIPPVAPHADNDETGQ